MRGACWAISIGSWRLSRVWCCALPRGGRPSVPCDASSARGRGTSDAPLPLRGSGELGLGSGTTLRFTAGERTVLLEGSGGLDRSLRALVGADAVPLEPLFPEAAGLTLQWNSGARLVRAPEVSVRVG